MTAYFAEFIGTMMLLLLGNGVCANVSLKKTLANGSDWIVIAFGWGFAVFVGVFIAGSISGAHLNPAVTIGLAVAGKFDWALVPGYIGFQVIGAFTGAFLAYLTYKDNFTITEDPSTRLGVFSTGPVIPNTLSNLLSEIIGTFTLVFGVFFLVEGDGLGSLSALPVAFLVVAIGLSLGGVTGYAINPARDFGPRVFHSLKFGSEHSNWKYAWIPIVGPSIGATLAALMYLLLVAN